MRIMQEFTSEPHTCHYLPDQTAKLHYSFAPELSAEEYEHLMNTGHRKFGPIFFKPVCQACTQCRPMRVPIEEFTPSRSQRRAWKRNQDLEVRYAPASVDVKRLELYTRYHQAQNARKGWEAGDGDPDEYALSYVKNPVPNIEISLWEKGTILRGIIHNDVTPSTVSAIYHFHDPDCDERSLGTCLILHSFELGRMLKKKWLYLGYYVGQCGSLSYKANYRPCEIMDTSGVWRQFDPKKP
jgi:arginyl-tRNA--protein-N-Asp/Glu arginylyltransferase